MFVVDVHTFVIFLHIYHVEYITKRKNNTFTTLNNSITIVEVLSNGFTCLNDSSYWWARNHSSTMFLKISRYTQNLEGRERKISQDCGHPDALCIGLSQRILWASLPCREWAKSTGRRLFLPGQLGERSMVASSFREKQSIDVECRPELQTKVKITGALMREHLRVWADLVLRDV